MTEEMKIQKQNRMDACNEYFNELAKLLEQSHMVMLSSNKDQSRYLIPNGTDNEVTYYGKPFHSFRVSNHWNWKANIRKCVDPRHVQCFTKDLHYPFHRPKSGMASKPVLACCVCYYGLDKLYHVVCGEVYDHVNRSTHFIRRDPKEVIAEMQEDYLDWLSKLKEEALSA